MKKTFMSFYLGQTRLAWDICWLVAAPLGLWLVAFVYVPLFGGSIKFWETWLLTLLIGVSCLVCLVAHALAHLFVARRYKGEIISSLHLYPLGDASQVWPPARTPRDDFLIALSGPLCSGVIGVGAYLVWNMQPGTYLNLIMLFLVFFNGGVALFNLIPVFPLDGGRLLRAICWGLLERPAAATVWAARGGIGISFLLLFWSIFLLIQQTRYSLWAGGANLVLAVLVAYPLHRHPVNWWNGPGPIKKNRGLMGYLRGSLALVLIAGLLGITLVLVPTNNGLRLPGASPTTTPMIQIPRENFHPSDGSFLITTVALQTPILAGQWLYALWNPAVEVVPPERVVPADRTIREMSQHSYRMLETSKITAVSVGLTRAGYEVIVSGQGVRIVSLTEESPAFGLLQPGDVIIGMDNQPVLTLPDLMEQLKQKDPSEPVQLQIQGERGKKKVSVNLMPPPEAGAPPRLGLFIEPAGYDYKLPFPVTITPQKITGGPSAGLMLALTTYNLVTPEDLTGGHIIAGTGTVNLEGTVGPVGGLKQKVAGAEWAGATYFLVPPQNYEDALAAARRIEVIQVGTVEEALSFLQNLPPL